METKPPASSRAARIVAGSSALLLALVTAESLIAAEAMAGSSTKPGSGGALSRATRAVGNATNSSSSRGSNSSSSSSSSSSDDTDTDTDTDDDGGGTYYGGSGNSFHAAGYCYGCQSGPPAVTPMFPGSGGSVRVGLELGLQAVRDSDGAGTARARITWNRLGLDVTGSRYFEEAPAYDGSDMVYLNVWSISGLFRLGQAARTSVWLSGGYGEFSSNNFEMSPDPVTLRSAVLGVQVNHLINSTFDVRGDARYYVAEQGLRAGEVRAALGISVVSLGYRVFRFDVGPPLHGPEIGLALGF